MFARIIAIEGLDGVGKETQAKLLKQNLESEGYKVSLFSFPNYDNDSSFFIKKYLAGDFGTKMEPKGICMLYAIDRYLTMNFDEDFKEMMRTSDFVIFDRYVASNIICQCGYVARDIKRDNYSTSSEIFGTGYRYNLAKWIYSIEHYDLNLPVPALTIYLDLKPDAAYKMIEHRNAIDNTDKSIDIYETKEMQEYFYDSFGFVDEFYFVKKINCNADPHIKSDLPIKDMSTISSEVFEVVKNYLIN